MKTVVFVDGENFQKKIKQVYRQKRLGWDEHAFGNIKLKQLLHDMLPDFKIDEIRYYVAKLHVYKETKEKSEDLVALQRALKSNLEAQKVNFITSGNVRMFSAGKDVDPVFKEKGVDVRLAVDMISLAADRKLKTAVICSSDSDMQPVITELKRRKVHTVYLGFQAQPNKGLVFTCDETILLRNNELPPYIQPKPPLKVARYDEDHKK